LRGPTEISRRDGGFSRDEPHLELEAHAGIIPRLTAQLLTILQSAIDFLRDVLLSLEASLSLFPAALSGGVECRSAVALLIAAPSNVSLLLAFGLTATELRLRIDVARVVIRCASGGDSSTFEFVYTIQYLFHCDRTLGNLKSNTEYDNQDISEMRECFATSTGTGTCICCEHPINRR